MERAKLLLEGNRQAHRRGGGRFGADVVEARDLFFVMGIRPAREIKPDVLVLRAGGGVLAPPPNAAARHLRRLAPVPPVAEVPPVYDGQISRGAIFIVQAVRADRVAIRDE